MKKNNIINFLKILTVLILTSLILYRFRLRIPKDIFYNPTIYYLYIYVITLIINFIILVILYIEYKEYKFNMKKNNIFINFLKNIKTWIENSYEKMMDYISELPGIFSIALAYTTDYYIKTPIIILQFIAYIPKILLCLSLLYDVFYLEKFEYSYYMFYLLLLTLISKAILYISIEINKRILEEVKLSINMVNPEETIKKYYDETTSMFEANEFKLSERNKEFTSVEHALTINHLVINELKKLENIENKLKYSLKFTLIIRLLYVFIFAYIVYFYPINVF